MSKPTLMPDNSELTMQLAEKAFALLGRGHFEVSASLSVDNAESLKSFGEFQSLLLMAYREGQASTTRAAAGEPDLWLSEQHGTLVAMPGYLPPDTSVYKNWRAADYRPASSES